MLARALRLPKPAATRGFAAAAQYADLKGKVVVVAGAGNPPSERDGLGATTSLTLAAHGAKVISVSHVAENCETVTGKIKAAGNQGFAHVADCTDYAQVEKLRDAVLAEHGRVDVLINAGIHDALPNGFKKMTLEKWKSNMDLNLNAHFYLIHAFLPTFQEQNSGNIIHFTTFGSAVGLGMGATHTAPAASRRSSRPMGRDALGHRQPPRTPCAAPRRRPAAARVLRGQGRRGDPHAAHRHRA
jgi:NAD(P)-dependent dehydrogenase (short-subunit alcohol dehydrogenase family)